MAEAGFIILGGIQKVKADRKRRKSQIQAAEAEAEFIEMQAARSEKVKDRQLELLEFESNQVLGNQVSDIASSGIDLSGTALEQVMLSQATFGEERADIIAETDFDIQLSMARAQQHRIGATRIHEAGASEDLGTILGTTAGVVKVASKAAGAGAGG